MVRPARILVAVVTLVVAAVAVSGCATSRLRLVGGERFEVVGVDPAVARAYAGPWSDVFAVRVAAAGADAPPMLGMYAVSADGVRFTPRFPLAAGVRYRATFDGARLGGDTSLSEEFAIPASSAPPVRVQVVYPSADVLPENLLRFYVQFSGSVGRGEVYRHVTVRDDTTGTLVDLPFLEIAEELWDRSGTRLTLLIDPGRIKSKLRPRIEAGPVFRAGHRYTLKLDGRCEDAEGRPLARSFEKRFRVVDADTTQPSPETWKLTRPPAGTSDALEVRFPEPLDHALLQHMIEVVGPGGRAVDGAIEVFDGEASWRFRPAQAWTRGDHHLRIDTALEDRVGNSIRALFEVDVFGVTKRRIEKRVVRLPVVVR